MSKSSVNPTNYEGIPACVQRGKEDHVHAVIETPGGIRHKYAFVPEFGIMALKMTLAEGLAWPYDYGFVPQTLADDGDPIDILVIGEEPTFSGCLRETRLLGIVHLAKNGVENDRLIAAPARCPGVALKTDTFDKVGDIPDAMIEGIKRFLVEYSYDEGNKIEFRGIGSRKDARRCLEAAEKAYQKKHER